MPPASTAEIGRADKIETGGDSNRVQSINRVSLIVLTAGLAISAFAEEVGLIGGLKAPPAELQKPHPSGSTSFPSPPLPSKATFPGLEC